MSIPLDHIPDGARMAWTRLRDELATVLGEDLVAIWAYGGTTATDGPPRAADLDTYVIVRRRPDAQTAHAIDATQAAIGEDLGVEFDTWVVTEADARRRESPRHAFRSDRRDTTWAITRAHWLAGRFANLHGADPADIVRAPGWHELEADLDREVEHLEAHVAAGDTDPFEATYAVLNGSRILRALETSEVASSKWAAGRWALEHLPHRWHPVLRAAGRAYEGEATSEDSDLLATEMSAFVAMVRARLPSASSRAAGSPPRWSGS
jgi:hypothetical protein